MESEWLLERNDFTCLCLNCTKTLGLGKVAIVLGNCLRSQQEKGHPDTRLTAVHFLR